MVSIKIIPLRKYDFIKSSTIFSANSNLNNQTNFDLNFNFANSNLQLNFEKYIINLKYNQELIRLFLS